MLHDKPHDLQRILYVDDDQDILTLVQLALEKIGGFQVYTCNSSGAFISVAESINPDLILLDVMMPGVSGTSLLSALKNNAALNTTPVVFITACLQTSEINKYKLLGILGVIPKPFNARMLPEEIGKLWMKRHNTAQVNSARRLSANGTH